MMAEELYQWKHRKLNRNYYNFVTAKVLALNPSSLLEIGPNHALLSVGYFLTVPTITMVDKIEIDPFSKTLFGQAGIRLFQRDVLADDLSDIQLHDVLVCLQVIEHVENPEEFVHRVWGMGKRKIFSAPYLWEGDNKYHIHSGIDLAKFRSWFPEDPVSLRIVREETGYRRIVARWEE